MRDFWSMAGDLLETLTARIPQLEAAHAQASGERRERLHAVLDDARLCLELFGRHQPRPALRGAARAEAQRRPEPILALPAPTLSAVAVMEAARRG